MSSRKLEHIDLEITKECNLDCVHCSARSQKNVTSEELSLDEIEDLLNEARSLGLKQVGLTGGEPFLSKEKLEKVMDFCTNSLNVPVHIHTNGMRINKADSKRISHIVDEVTIALYGTNAQTHDSITRRKGSMESTWKGLQRLIDAGANVSVYIVPMKSNAHEIIPLVRMVSKKGIKKIRFLSLSPTGRARERYEEMSLENDKITWLNNQLEDIQPKIAAKLYTGFCTSQFFTGMRTLPGHDSCYAAENRIHVDAFGNVFPCTASSGLGIFRAGNMREDCTLSELWKYSPLFQFIRNFHSNPPQKCQNCSIHKNCMSGCRVMMTHKYGDVTVADPECVGPVYR